MLVIITTGPDESPGIATAQGFVGSNPLPPPYGATFHYHDDDDDDGDDNDNDEDDNDGNLPPTPTRSATTDNGKSSPTSCLCGSILGGLNIFGRLEYFWAG